jgi:hypothetical protein
VNAAASDARVNDMRCVVVLSMLLFGACASGSNKPNRDFTLQTTNGASTMSLGANGQIIGPNIQLSSTNAGYRGMADSGMVDLRSDGEHILGTINNRIVDMHVTLTGDGLRARGLFGGRLGRIDASNTGITSNLGRCTYELAAKGQRYVGQRACGRGSSYIPMTWPASLELPVGFERLGPDRQAMLLAIMLGQ